GRGDSALASRRGYWRRFRHRLSALSRRPLPLHRQRRGRPDRRTIGGPERPFLGALPSSRNPAVLGQALRCRRARASALIRLEIAPSDLSLLLSGNWVIPPLSFPLSFLRCDGHREP